MSVNDSVQTNKDVLNKLTTYANAYAIYQSYLDTSANCFVDPSCALYSQYNQALANYNSAQSEFQTVVYNAPTNDPSSSYSDIVSKISSITSIRKSIDQDKNRLQAEGSTSGIFPDSKSSMDYTVFASLCWTVLATSALYVIFVEL